MVHDAGGTAVARDPSGCVTIRPEGPFRLTSPVAEMNNVTPPAYVPAFVGVAIVGSIVNITPALSGSAAPNRAVMQIANFIAMLRSCFF